MNESPNYARIREKNRLLILVMITGFGLIIYLIIGEVTLHQELESLPKNITNPNNYKDEKVKPLKFEEYIQYSNLLQQKIIAQNSVRTTFFSALSGVLFSFTAYFSWKNLKVSEDTLKENQETNERKQIAERFNKGVDLLAHDKINVQMGGIYVLEEIANSNNSYYKPVMEMLTSYLRNNAPLVDTQEVKASCQNFKSSDRANIQAILTIFGKDSKRKKKDSEKFKLNLSKTDLQGLEIGGDWSDANFSGANLSKVNLAHVKMVGADFRNAILKDTIFTQANLNYADFRGAKNLTREQINKAKSHEGIYLPDDIARSTPTDSNSKP